MSTEIDIIFDNRCSIIQIIIFQRFVFFKHNYPVAHVFRVAKVYQPSFVIFRKRNFSKQYQQP